jgi:hypothetical protein
MENNSNLTDAYETSGTSPSSNDTKTDKTVQTTDKKDKAKKKQRWRETAAKKILEVIHQRHGRVLLIDNQLVAVHEDENSLLKYRLDRDDLYFDQLLYEVAGVTHSEYDGRLITDRVRILGLKKARRVKYGHFSLYVPPSSSNRPGQLLISESAGLLRIGAASIERVKKAQDYYVEASGLEWGYQSLSNEQRVHAAKTFLDLLAYPQAQPASTRVALALSLALFPFIRARLDTRPIIQFSGEQGSGKSFAADRFAFLLYGNSGLASATEAALRRSNDPLILLDDIERVPTWLRDHLRRASTGTRHKSVRTEGQGFAVADSPESDAIHVLTAIRIPTDSPLLSRTWLFTFGKEHFDPAFKNELATRQAIVQSRSFILSFLVDVLAEAFRLEEGSGLTDLTVYGKLPAERTWTAQAVLLLLLRAFDSVAPDLIDPDNEFRGFLDNQRGEQETLQGQTTDELTLLSQLFDDVEDGGINDPRIAYRDGCIVVGASKLSEIICEKARRQGIRLQHDMNAVNVGKWLKSEVKNSAEFWAEETTIGSGSKKRKAWKIGRKPDVAA